MKAINFSLKPNQDNEFPVNLIKDNKIVKVLTLSGSEIKLVIKNELNNDKDLINQVREATKIFRVSGVKITKKYNY